MAIDFSVLTPDFRNKLNNLLNVCKSRGVEMRPYFGVRTPLEQAKFWRQSRTAEEIEVKIASLRSQKAHFLADCTVFAGPQNGPRVTDAIPGLSWHQWGEVADCAWVVDEKSEWSTLWKIDGFNGYRVYVGQASLLGLDAGGLRDVHKDWPPCAVEVREQSGEFFLP